LCKLVIDECSQILNGMVLFFSVVDIDIEFTFSDFVLNLADF